VDPAAIKPVQDRVVAGIDSAKQPSDYIGKDFTEDWPLTRYKNGQELPVHGLCGHTVFQAAT
jgi:hypothetical protein